MVKGMLNSGDNMLCLFGLDVLLQLSFLYVVLLAR